MAKRVRTLPRIPGVANSCVADGKSASATIAIYSVKGGVGKTTLSANLAWCSAQAGRKTLLWDLDAAGGAGFLFRIDAKEAKPAETVFSGNRSPDKLIRNTGYDNLDLLPADESIRTLDETLVALGKRKRLAKLVAALGVERQEVLESGEKRNYPESRGENSGVVRVPQGNGTENQAVPVSRVDGHLDIGVASHSGVCAG